MSWTVNPSCSNSSLAWPVNSYSPRATLHRNSPIREPTRVPVVSHILRPKTQVSGIVPSSWSHVKSGRWSAHHVEGGSRDLAHVCHLRSQPIVKQEPDFEFAITCSFLGSFGALVGGWRIDVLDAQSGENTPGISASAGHQTTGLTVETQLGDPDRFHGGEGVGAAQVG